MCGIVGVLHFDRSRPVDRARLIAQTDTLVHRGPNDGGVWVGDGVGLGQRRLSIIDLSSGGHQPLFDASGRWAVVFNGEIYNYLELRHELSAKGHRFRTDSDTEVLLYAYVEWGDACVERFRGMFAFAIYDAAEHALFLGRDPLGKKPLYYYRDADRIVFASELKAVLADPTIPREIDATAVADYFALSYVPGPKTIFNRMLKLPPAHTLAISPAGARMHAYWDVDYTSPDLGSSAEQHAVRLLELITEAVRLRLRSDVPLGAFLSGGVDSSAIVAVMAQLSERPVLTNSIGFDVERYDERPYARQIAARFQTDHREQVLSPEAGEIVRQLSWFYDEPFGDSSAAPTYHLCAMTRKHVTVALSGDGGDELFAGYYHYRDSLWADSIRGRLPGWLRRAALTPLRHLFQVTRYSSEAFGYNSIAWRAALDADRSDYNSLLPQPWRFREMLSRDFLASLGGYDPYDAFRSWYERSRTGDHVSRMQYVDLKTYLPDDILVKVDRASMAHALEVRCPLLDHKVVEYAARIPSSFKIQENKTKLILKQAIRGLIPPETFDRKKMGFAIPIAKWFRTALREPAEALFFAKPGGASGTLSRYESRRLWVEHQAGLVDHGTQLWNAMMFELWYRRFIEGASIEVGATDPMKDHRPTADDTVRRVALSRST